GEGEAGGGVAGQDRQDQQRRHRDPRLARRRAALVRRTDHDVTAQPPLAWRRVTHAVGWRLPRSARTSTRWRPGPSRWPARARTLPAGTPSRVAYQPAATVAGPGGLRRAGAGPVRGGAGCSPPRSPPAGGAA